ARTADQRARRALRSPRHLCRDLLRDPGQRLRVHLDGEARAMAEAGRLRLAGEGRGGGRPPSPVAGRRVGIIVAVLAGWEALAASGLLYRDVVPSLGAIGKALYATLSDPTFYFHLGTTAYEIGIAMVIGGLSGLAVGIVLGGSKFMARAYEAYLYYLGPC